MSLEHEVELRAPEGTRLAGTLVEPGGSLRPPAALLLSGSGPLDRDSNMRGQPLDVMNAIAAELADRGIASLRYDKRGVGESEGDYLRTGLELETDDAAAALDWLGGRSEADPGRLAVVGHSVGATIAIRLASAGETVAGVVLLAGAARSGEEVMRWQSDRIAGALTGLRRLGARWVLRRQERARRSLRESTGDVVRISGQRLPARWFREYMRYDPTDDLARITCPVLAITGRNDVQVDANNVDRMGELVGGPFTARTPETLTHLLRTDPRAGLAGYAAQLKRPVDADLLTAVATWLSQVLRPADAS